MKNLLLLLIVIMCSSCVTTEYIDKKENVITWSEIKLTISDVYTKKIRRRDNYYKTIDKNYFDKVLVSHVFRIAFSKYLEESFDCDDFTLYFMSNAGAKYAIDHGKGYAPTMFYCAIVTPKGTHAVVMYIDSDRIIRYFDPQTNRYIEASDVRFVF